MRVAILACFAVVLLCSAAFVCAQTPSPAQARTAVQQAFDQSSQWRQANGTEATAWDQGSVNSTLRSHFFDDSVYPIVQGILEGPDSGVWWKAVVDELGSSMPNRRALACEIVGLKSDAAVIPRLGALLNDTAQAPPVPGWGVPQKGSGFIPWLDATIGQLARSSLIAQTRLNFTNRAAFEEWWKDNREYADKTWYWYAKWTYKGIIAHNSAGGHPYYGGHTKRRDFSPEMAELSRLPKDTALKMLLVCGDYRGPKRDPETDAAMRAKGYNWSYDEIATQGPGEQHVAAFIEKSGLKPRLSSLLYQKDLWPEMVSFEGLVRQICPLAKYLFTPSDEPLIAGALLVNTPNKASFSDLTILRADIAPLKARIILTDAMRSHPEITDLPCSFIRRFGTVEPQLLMKCYWAAHGSESSRIAGSLWDAAQHKLPVSRSFISDLLNQLDTPDDNSGNVLSSLTRTANTITGKEIVSNEELNQLHQAKVSREENERREAEFPETFRSIRDRVLAAL
jgi:hypothetical protein